MPRLQHLGFVGLIGVHAVACGPGTSIGEDDGLADTDANATGVDSDSASSSSSAASSDGASDTDTGGSQTGSTTAGVEVCDEPPLSAVDLESLTLRAGWDPLAPVGGTRQISMQTRPGAGGLQPCVQWSVEPSELATIDASGVLEVPAATAPGTVLTVTADIEAGRRVLTLEVTTYEPVDAPLVGNWTEILQFPCDGNTESSTPPEQPMEELSFDDSGRFRATWAPFDLQVDYRGTWSFDPSSQTLTMTVEGGSYVPADLDPEGTAFVNEDGQLVLDDLWLGAPQGSMSPTRCGHVLE